MPLCVRAVAAPYAKSYGSVQLAVHRDESNDEGKHQCGKRHPHFDTHDKVYIKIKTGLHALNDGYCVVGKDGCNCQRSQGCDHKDDKHLDSKERKQVARLCAHRAAQCHFAGTEGEELQLHFQESHNPNDEHAGADEEHDKEERHEEHTFV